MEITINKIIEEFNLFNLEDREFMLDVMHKQLIESKRELILKRTKEAEKNLKKGSVRKGNVYDLLKDLNND